MKLSKELLIILIIQITEVLGFSLILPFLPFYAQSLGASPLTVALILSSFSLFQFISAPILGRLSDIYGRRPLLIASQISTFISFLILAKSTSLTMIFISRAVDGLLGSNFTITQAYISDISTKKNRSKAFGISGMAFGIGFLIGPAIGGFLSKFGFSIPAFTATTVSFLTILATLFFLPETVTRKIKTSKIILIDWSVFTKYLSNKKTSIGLWQFLSYIMTHAVWSSNLALYTDRKFGFKPQDIGFILAYIGLTSIVLRGFLLPKLIDKYGEKQLKKVSVLTIILGLMGLMRAKVFWWIFPAMSLLAFGNALARPLIMGSISKSVNENEQGAVIGLANSLGSLSRIVGPLIGGYLLTNFFPESVMLASMFFMALGGIL
ncbi:MFS transporter, partial [Patescibacteria group bacterium]|nr:MFS transporter [Patescibacteria group bacterium]